MSNDRSPSPSSFEPHDPEERSLLSPAAWLHGVTGPGSDLRPASLRAQRFGVDEWTSFADRHHLPSSLAEVQPLDLAAFVYECLYIRQLKRTTVNVYLSGITRSRAIVLGGDDKVGAPARRLFGNAVNEITVAPIRPAVVLPIWLLKEMLGEMIPGRAGYEALASWRAVRDRALLAAMYSGALRPGEALAARVSDLTRTADGWVLRLNASKTNQDGHRREQIVISDADPLRSGRLLAAWLDDRGDLPGDALFPYARDGIEMSHKAASRRVRAAATRCGHTDGAVTLHSLRRSRVTHLHLASASLDSLQRLLRHEHLATTSLYVDALHHLTTEEARDFHLAPTRPANATANGLGRRQRSGPRPAGPNDPTIAELRELAKAALTRARYPLSPKAAGECERLGDRWVRFAARAHADAIDPDPRAVAAFFVELHRSGVRSGTLKGYLGKLEHWFITQDPAGTPPTEAALPIVEGARRLEAGRKTKRAPVHPRPTYAQLAESTASAQGDTRTLDLAVLRWHLGRVTGYRQSPQGPMSIGDVQLSDDLQEVRIHIGETDLRLSATGNELTCPVSAVRRILARAEHDCAVAKWKLLNGTSQLHYHGIDCRVETWDEATFRNATWVLGRGVRNAALSRLVICVAWAGALRMADVREARIEELEGTPEGYLLVLGRSKMNRTGRYEPIRFDRTGDALCPVDAIEGWLSMTGATNGPLVFVPPARLAPKSVRPHVDGNVTNKLVKRIARSNGVALTGHSFRRSRATHERFENGADVSEIRRLLRHKDLTYTLAYIEEIDPGAFDITEGLVARRAARRSDATEALS